MNNDSDRRRRRRSGAGSQQPVSPLQLKVLALVVLGVSLLVAVSAARMVPAGIASYQAQAFMAHWRKSGQEPGAEAWHIARDAGQRSVNLYPVANGLYLNQLGLVEQWKSFRHAFAEPDAEDSRRASLTALRQAVTARPTWPSGWVDLAWAKVYLQEFDSEFEHALQEASRLGPWRIGINRAVSEIGFTNWPHLTPELRALVLESTRRAVAHSPRETRTLMQIAGSTGMSDTLCGALPRKLADDRKICSGNVD